MKINLETEFNIGDEVEFVWYGIWTTTTIIGIEIVYHMQEEPTIEYITDFGAFERYNFEAKHLRKPDKSK